MERKIRGVSYEKIFLKHLSKLPKNIIEKSKEKEQIFKENAFHPILRTHKLHGNDKKF